MPQQEVLGVFGFLHLKAWGSKIPFRLANNHQTDFWWPMESWSGLNTHVLRESLILKNQCPDSFSSLLQKITTTHVRKESLLWKNWCPDRMLLVLHSKHTCGERVLPLKESMSWIVVADNRCPDYCSKNRTHIWWESPSSERIDVLDCCS